MNFSKLTHTGEVLHYETGVHIYIWDSYIPPVIRVLVYTASTEMSVHQFCMLFNPKAVQKLLSNQESHCSDTEYSNVLNTTYMRWNLLFSVQ